MSEHPIFIDVELSNSDWAKRTWDLPEDKEEFLAFLKRSGTSIAEFKKLPVYKWNKDRIEWLKDL